MELRTIKQETTETFVEGNGISVSINSWSNHEGASVLIHGQGAEMPLRMAGAFRWEEIDVLIAALSIARSA